jgi:hypothetical protein
MQTIRHQLPRSLPALIEVVVNGECVFKCSEKATVADWKTELRLAKQRGELPRSAVHRMVRLAKLLKLSDETPLLPRIIALADTNVVSIRPTDPPGSIRNGADLYQKRPIEGPITRGPLDDGPYRKE